MHFEEKILTVRTDPLHATGIDILQVNMGYRCNMACKHCHVQAGPAREEMMDIRTVEEVLVVLNENRVKTLDVTGGAPELNPFFRYLVEEARHAGCRVIARSNLTIFYEPGMEDLFDFYSRNSVELIASIPYYREADVDKVRGNGAFRKSIDALRQLNRMGYGADKALNLVHNPTGAFLPPSQSAMEKEYREDLKRNYDISFHSLYTFANIPIGRFREFLIRSKNYDKYLRKLTDAFNPETLQGIMCRHLVNVGWDGTLYDCDFNQMIGLALLDRYPRNIRDFDHHLLAGRQIAVDDHCYGCTAGQGST
ncbi:MAG: arsenosugar biosynthesis radical SAM protein ArsS [Nitrospirota bacterium]|nr:arsenosugar biosynthesis radical SAM protein ArsS [Nitrospirota bacterium]